VNITSPDAEYYTEYVVDNLAVERLMLLLEHEKNEMTSIALWGLSNIAGDSEKYRDLLLEQGIIDPMLKIAHTMNPTPEFFENYSSLISNLVSGKPYPDFGQVGSLLPTLVELLAIDNEEVIINTLWSISRIANQSEEALEEVLNMEILGYVIKMLQQESISIQAPALRIVGNLVVGNDDQTQRVLDSGILPYLALFMKSSKSQMKKEICWIWSNILASNEKHITLAFSIPHFYENLKALLIEPSFVIAKEALICVTNATSSAATEVIQYMVDRETIELLTRLLTTYQDEEYISYCISALDNILDVGHQMAENGAPCNPYLLRLEACGGVKVVENLQQHSSVKVYEEISEFIDKFFSVEGLKS